MHLDQYLKGSNITISEFAHIVGVSADSIRKYKNNIRRPNLDHALAIERATNGDVPAEIWENVKRAGS